jgi:hypothetical protein
MGSAEMPDTVREAIGKVVDYSLSDELRDYKECERNGNSTENHIFLSLSRVRAWLEQGSASPAVAVTRTVAPGKSALVKIAGGGGMGAPGVLVDNETGRTVTVTITADQMSPS